MKSKMISKFPPNVLPLKDSAITRSWMKEHKKMTELDYDDSKWDDFDFLKHGKNM